MNKPLSKITKEKKALPSWVQKGLDALSSPIFLGLVITGLFLFFAESFYQVRNQNQVNLADGRLSTKVFRAVEALDFMLADARFQIRGEKKSPAPVALLTIDDRSIEQVGRWPWSREKIAEIVDRMMGHGAKAIGFDIVFSEKQENASIETLNQLERLMPNLPADAKSYIEQEKSKGSPDALLAQSLEKYKDRIVLGVFPDSLLETNPSPYTDYCRNEAFKRMNSSELLKIENITFAVLDATDIYESVDFEPLFSVIFKEIEKTETTKALKEQFEKSDLALLSKSERIKLTYHLNQQIMQYCDRWLTPQDEMGPVSEQFFAALTKDEKIKPFFGMTPAKAIEDFSRKVLLYPMPQYLFWTGNIPEFQAATTYTGSFAAMQDDDGKIRHNPLFYRTGNKLMVSFIPSLALQTYLIAHPGYQAEVEVDYDPKDPSQKTIKNVLIKNLEKDSELVTRIPVDGLGRLKINYAGGTHMFPYVPASEILTDKPTMKISERTWDPTLKGYVFQEREVNKSEFIKDRSFLFGATAIGVYDLRVTPFEKNYPGPETHLTVMANLFDQSFLRVDPNEQLKMIWALVGLGVLITLAVAKAGAVMGFALTGLSELALAFLDQYLLIKKGITATMILPALLIASLYVFLTLYKYFTEERKKAHLRSTFAKYVSPAVVDEILKSPENIELGGKKQRMSVFFSDVRGFTTISEKLDPQVLSDVLNLYLTPMTKIVFDNKGTLDKYMGDAVMAFFGAPIHYSDHAKYACRCALASIKKLKELQLEFKAQGLPEIDIGIGINTSDMSVGNMGSDIVRSYTVMGDGVNLGSRLEGINKEYGTRIVISQFTYADVKDDFTARELDWVRVKGKLEPVRIYELVCEGKAPDDWALCLEKFNAGFTLYHDKKFAEAKTSFEAALVARPQDPPSELYIERCNEYLEEPPPENWDGVYVMKTK